MASPDNLKNIRTLEDVSYMINILFTNLNNLDALYYDMFINPNPLTLELERYDENGRIVKVLLNNRAKDNMRAYSGSGSPNGVQVADRGALYVDELSSTIYYKSSSGDAQGWVLIWAENNMVEGTNYLAPNGNGSQLTGLNATNITSGTLSVEHGGTGVEFISGIIKGNEENPFTQAEDGVDYLGPNSMIGLISYYPVILYGGVPQIPNGWLRLDGAAYSVTTYNNLFNKIGYTYGSVESGTKFRVPDAQGLFIRSWKEGRVANEIEHSQVGSHNHSLQGCVTGSGSPHTHGRGTLDHNHTYTAPSNWGADGLGYSPAHWSRGDSGWQHATGTMSNAKNWTGSLAEESTHFHYLEGSTALNSDNSETIVENIAFVPIIKY